MAINSIALLDVQGEYMPHKDVGRPRIKWDDQLRAFFAHHFPPRTREHWLRILRNEEFASLEQHFVDFCLSR